MEQKEIVKWDVPTPFRDDPGPPVKILKIKPKTPCRGLVLSEAVVGVKTHWLYGRTKPCIGVEHGCEGCARSIAWRWKGYLAVYLPASKTTWLLEVTQHAFDHNLELCSVSGLRGRDFVATRHGQEPNGRMEIQLLPSLTKPENVPPDVDVKEVLLRVWFGREKGAKNNPKNGGNNDGK